MDVTVDGDLGAIAEDDAPAHPGRVGRYTILGVIGMGGMGVVYTAFDPKLDRKIALKLLRERPTQDALTTLTAGKARLLREAQALARLTHPNVVQVYDVDVWESQLYITMEYVEGRSLKEWLAEGPHPRREILEVFRAAGEGLAAAHAVGIVHRDFKPGNVLIGDDGRVRVLDFGLAKRADEEDPPEPERRDVSGELPGLAESSSVIGMAVSAGDLTLTQAGRSVGTPAYMSPEQHLGIAVGPETDQFSFCVSLWEALYGEIPFAGESLDERFRNVVAGELRAPPTDHNVPNWIHRILVRGLQPRAEDRYPNMRDLLEDLGRDPARSRRRLLAAAAAAALVAGGTFGVVQARNARNELCAGGQERVASVWSPSAGDAIRRAFLDTGLPFAGSSADRVIERLDAHARSWADVYGRICQATHLRGEQSGQLMDQRMACLQRDLAQTAALIETFSAPDAKAVERAVSAVDQLDDPATCATWTAASRAQDLDPARAALAQELQTELARARALHTAGHFEEAGALAQTISDRAKEAELPGVCAKALTAVASYQQTQGKWEDAERSLAEAIRMATRAGDPRTETEGWATLMFVKARERGQLEAARELMLPAETALERAGHPDRVELAFDRSRAAVSMELGSDAEALAAYRKAVATAERIYGEDSTNTATAWSNLAVALARTGEVAEAEQYLERAVALLERTLGAKHPDVAGALQNLSNVAILRRDYAKARDLLLRVKAIREATKSPKLAGTLLNLGVTNRGLGDLAAARDSYLEAEALMRSTRGERYPHLVAVYNNLANLFEQLGEPERALTYAEKAVALAQDRFKPGHRRRTGAWLRLCQARSASGSFSAARQACERALEELRAKHGKERPPVSETAEALLALGQIALATGEPRRALELARGAREVFAALEGEDEGLTRAWILQARALHPLGRRDEAQRAARTASQAIQGDGPVDADEREFLAWARDQGLLTGEVAPVPVPN